MVKSKLATQASGVVTIFTQTLVPKTRTSRLRGSLSYCPSWDRAAGPVQPAMQWQTAIASK